jgi:hypothetical protein
MKRKDTEMLKRSFCDHFLLRVWRIPLTPQSKQRFEYPRVTIKVACPVVALIDAWLSGSVFWIYLSNKTHIKRILAILLQLYETLC